MFVVREVKYCLVFITIVFISVSWGQLDIIVVVMV
jgi:hypothetical protein